MKNYQQTPRQRREIYAAHKHKVKTSAPRIQFDQQVRYNYWMDVKKLNVVFRIDRRM